LTSQRDIDVQRLGRDRAATVWQAAAEEYRRFVELLRQLDTADWCKPTDCARWEAREVAIHVLGATEANSSPIELVHQFRRGIPLNRRIDSHHWVDGINELQVRERTHLEPVEIIRRMEVEWPRAVRGRRFAPPPLRWLPVPFGPPIGWKPLSYLLREGFTRDTWMHRIDIARATDRPLTLTAAHDGRLVQGIVAEWAVTHGQAFTADLGGPAGGRFAYRSGGPRLELDAIEFCRILAGRGQGDGLLENKLPTA
jgi:uncharacterized protein (TIGR03083 family)